MSAHILKELKEDRDALKNKLKKVNEKFKVRSNNMLLKFLLFVCSMLIYYFKISNIVNFDVIYSEVKMKLNISKNF